MAKGSNGIRFALYIIQSYLFVLVHLSLSLCFFFHSCTCTFTHWDCVYSFRLRIRLVTEIDEISVLKIKTTEYCKWRADCEMFCRNEIKWDYFHSLDKNDVQRDMKQITKLLNAYQRIEQKVLFIYRESNALGTHINLHISSKCVFLFTAPSSYILIVNILFILCLVGCRWACCHSAPHLTNIAITSIVSSSTLFFLLFLLFVDQSSCVFSSFVRNSFC